MLELWQQAIGRANEERAAAGAPKSQAELKELEDETTKRYIEELTGFLESDEGKLGLRLLAAANRHIVLDEERDSSFGHVYYMDGEGLHISHEPMGMWMAYSQNVPEPQISPATPEDICRQLYKNKENSSVVKAGIGNFLRSSLNRIASGVVSENRTSAQIAAGSNPR